MYTAVVVLAMKKGYNRMRMRKPQRTSVVDVTGHLRLRQMESLLHLLPIDLLFIHRLVSCDQTKRLLEEKKVRSGGIIRNTFGSTEYRGPIM